MRLQAADERQAMCGKDRELSSKKMQAICKQSLLGENLGILSGCKLLILLMELTGIEPVTS
jgi:hypothetical protein